MLGLTLNYVMKGGPRWPYPNEAHTTRDFNTEFHITGTVMITMTYYIDVTWTSWGSETDLSRYTIKNISEIRIVVPWCGKQTGDRCIPSLRANSAEIVSMPWRHHVDLRGHQKLLSAVCAQGPVISRWLARCIWFTTLFTVSYNGLVLA